MSKLERRSTPLFVSLFCVGQYLWTLIHERHSLPPWGLAAATLGVARRLLVFQELYRRGNQLARRKPSRVPGVVP